MQRLRTLASGDRSGAGLRVGSRRLERRVVQLPSNRALHTHHSINESDEALDDGGRRSPVRGTADAHDAISNVDRERAGIDPDLAPKDVFDDGSGDLLVEGEICVHEIGSRDDPRQRSIGDDGQSIDAAVDHQARRFAERSIAVDRHGWHAHRLCGGLGGLTSQLLGIVSATEERREQMTRVRRSAEQLCHHICLGHDADAESIGIDDGHAADLVLVEQPCDGVERGLWQNADHVACHDVSDLHGRPSSFRCECMATVSGASVLSEVHIGPPHRSKWPFGRDHPPVDDGGMERHGRTDEIATCTRSSRLRRERIDRGRRLSIRPIECTDAAGLSDFYAHLSAESTRRRFLSCGSQPVEELGLTFARPGAGFVGILHEAGPNDGAIVAHASIQPDEKGGAEMAFAVADELQGRGIGTALTDLVVEHARRVGLRRLTATLYANNAPMRKLMRGAGCAVASDQIDTGVEEVVLAV
jgi:GNAT superfamily N-acetyltransferase